MPRCLGERDEDLRCFCMIFMSQTLLLPSSMLAYSIESYSIRSRKQVRLKA